MSKPWYEETFEAFASLGATPPGTPSRGAKPENTKDGKRIAEYEEMIKSLQNSISQKDKLLVKSRSRCKHLESSLREKELMLKTQVSTFQSESPEVKLLLDSWTLERSALLDQVKNLEDYLEYDKKNAVSGWRSKDSSLQEEIPQSERSLQKQLADKDSMISSLRRQILEYSGQLTELTTEVAQLKRRSLSTSGLNDSMNSNVSSLEGLQRTIEELMRERDALLSFNDENAIEVKLRDNDISFQSTALSTGEFDTEINSLKEKLEEKEKTIAALVKSCAKLEKEANERNSSSEVSPDQLKERDEAISKLVKQSMAQEKKVKELNDRLAAAGGSTSDKLEIESLRKEVEMFASQVLEQETEIDELKQLVAEKNTSIKELQNKISQVGSTTSPQMLAELEAEVDELKEANKVQLDELRLLRRKNEEFQKMSDLIAKERNSAFHASEEAERSQASLDKLKRENRMLSEEIVEYEEKVEVLERKIQRNKQALDEVEGLENQIREQNLLIEQMKKSSPGEKASKTSYDEMEIAEMLEENHSLKTQVETLSKSLENAKNTVRDLEEILAGISSKESRAFDVEKEEMLSEIENLTEKLHEAEKLLNQTETDRCLIDEFKFKLEQADEDREKSEKMIVDTYERKLSLLTLDKDVTIDKLRKQLSKEKEESTDKFEELQLQLEQYEASIKDLKEEAEAEIQQRETRIFALEQTLTAQEQLLNNMRTEMDHLQGSMEHNVYGRREEIDNLQQELMELGTTKTKQEREIKLLHSHIDELRHAHAKQIDLFKAKISDLESKHDQDIQPSRSAADVLMEEQFVEVQSRLEKLTRRNETLQEDNRALREHLEMIEKQEAKSEAMIQLQKRSSELRKELADYKDKVTELEKANSPSRKKGGGRISFLGRRKESTNSLPSSESR